LVRPIILIAGSIPVIVAILFAGSMLIKPEIPFSASNSDDVITIEYTKHQLQKISFGVTERVGSQKTEILTINNDGDVRYSVVNEGIADSDKKSTIDLTKVKKLKAIIKETGFMSIPSESFPVKEDVEKYEKFSIKVTLNGKTQQIHWPEQNATDKFVPPIITLVESELDQLIAQIIE